jgi:hypothetical protein
MKKAIIMATAAIAGTMLVASCACNNNSQKKKTAEESAVPEYTVIDNACVDLSQFKQDEDGYYVIFDGTSLDGWRGYGKENVPERWTIKDGCLHFEGTGTGEGQTKEGGDIIFSYKFKNFILEFDWMVEKGSNSGVFYLAQEVSTKDDKGNVIMEPIYISCPEYQILDNENHPDALLGVDGNRKSASLYDMIPANPQNFTKYGEWQTGKIMVYKGTVVHGQNGANVLEYHLWTQQWTDMLQASKFSEEKWPLAFELLNNCGGENHEGYIGFQDHGDNVWFRNIRVKIME